MTARFPASAADGGALPLVPHSDWDETSGSGHFVQFYDEDVFLLDAVSRFIGTALGSGGAAIVIATSAHRDGLSRALTDRGLDVGTIGACGRYITLDAAATLSEFLIDGWPDEARFMQILGGAVERAAAAADRDRPVRAFGEMVALLCADGRREAAIRVEELWNELAQQRRFSLFCAYPMNAFGSEAEGASFVRICAVHTQVIPAESYTALSTADERLRTVSRLQQKARALETETIERKKAQGALSRKEQQLEEKLAQLAEIDRRKDEFIAILGHELRNPLSAVQNAIAAARLDPSRRERALDIAHRQTAQLERLVDDLLEVARMTQGRLTLQMARVSLADIITRAVDATRWLVEARGHALVIRLPSDRITLDVDPARIEQVVANLLTNAAKFTEPGGRIEVLGERDGEEAVVRVRDTGSGIAPDMLPLVFDMFAQGQRTLDRAQGGLGIGLTVVRRVIELHGGRVEARSEGVGKGAEFVIWLPALSLPADAARCVPTEPAAARHARVLIVEDNVDAAESLSMLLELFGHQVHVAHNGADALEVIGRQPPDVVIVDIGLPGMDGYEVARRIRALPTARTTVLIALTGYGQDEDKQHARAAGFDYHLTKPVDLDALQRLVCRLGASTPASDEPPTLH